VRALVLAATGPVGSRMVSLLAAAGATVRVASRSLQRAESLCRTLSARMPQARLEPYSTESSEMRSVLDGVQVVISAAAPGVEVLTETVLDASPGLRVAIDLSAVPPAGISGIEPTDNGSTRGNCACYGALGVGRLKMKIHKSAVRQLFSANDLVLDAEQIFAIGQKLG
jgi:NADPH:quinone reductase-like Zn-dependent oxidoreductase